MRSISVSPCENDKNSETDEGDRGGEVDKTDGGSTIGPRT